MVWCVVAGRKRDAQRLSWYEMLRRGMPQCGCRTTSGAQQFMNRRAISRGRGVSRTSRCQLPPHGGDIGIHCGEAIQPVAALMRQWSDRDVRHVDAPRVLRELRPDRTRPVVLARCLLECRQARCAAVEGIEHAAAQLCGEEAAE